MASTAKPDCGSRQVGFRLLPRTGLGVARERLGAASASERPRRSCQRPCPGGQAPPACSYRLADRSHKDSQHSVLCKVPARPQETGSAAPEPRPVCCLCLSACRAHPVPVVPSLHPELSDRDIRYFSTSGLLMAKFRRREGFWASSFSFSDQHDCDCPSLPTESSSSFQVSTAPLQLSSPGPSTQG